MTNKEFIGCTLTAFGPAFSMFYWTIAEDPIRVILLISSAFFWLCSLLISSVIWYVFPWQEWKSFGVLTSICFQELFRYLIYRILRASEQGLGLLTDSKSVTADNRHLLSYVSGLGFGIISGAFSLVNILAAIKGPGTMVLKDGTEYFCLYSALFTMCFVFLHTFWSVIFFHALDTNNRSLQFYVIASHAFVSFISLINQLEMYSYTIISVFLVTVISAMLSYSIARGSARRSIRVQFELPRKTRKISITIS